MCYTMDDLKFAAQRELCLDNIFGDMFDLVDIEYHDLPWSCIFADNCVNLTHVPETLCIDGEEYSYELSVISKERVKGSSAGAIRCTVKHPMFGQFTLVLRRPVMETVFCPAMEAVAQVKHQAAMASAKANVDSRSSAEKHKDSMAAFATQFKTSSPKKSSGFKKFFKI
jgi:hypothetical protein